MKRIFVIALCLVFCLSSSALALAEELDAAYGGLAFTLNESGDRLLLGKAVWALLPDGTRAKAALPEGAQLSLEGFGDAAALSEPYGGPSPFVFTAVGDMTATSGENSLPLKYLDQEEVSLLNAMVTGVATVSLDGSEIALSEGDAIRVAASQSELFDYALLLG